MAGLFSVLTFATHAQGDFEALAAAVPDIHVGGRGQEWRGFLSKFRYVLDFAVGCDDQHVVIFVDGFDTQVRLPPQEAVRRFLGMGVPFLASSHGFEMHVPPLLSRRIFRCQESECANTGLYMGFAGAVRRVLEAALQEEDRALRDDQRAFELARSKLPPHFVRVDSRCEVFHNLNLWERRRAGQQTDDVRAVFVGTNGGSLGLSSWRACGGRALHFSRVLDHDAVLVVLVVSLALVWRRLALPSLCCGAAVFPAAVLACCVFG